MVITGDVNINKYLNMLSESGLISFINVFTRLPMGFKRSCLDHITINGNEHVTSKMYACVILTDITDHCTVCYPK